MITPCAIHITVDHERYTPVRANPTDAGADLKAKIESGSVTIPPGQQAFIPTGVKIAIPEGWVGLVTPRSGLALKQCISIRNTPGTIDSPYRGELKIILVNGGNMPMIVNDGDRIAQIVIVPCWLGEFEIVDALNTSERGHGGFGSTGV